MKNTTNKMVAAWLAATAIIALSFGSVSAMWGNGHWDGQGGGLGKVITSEEKAKLQSMDSLQRQEYMNELRVKYNVTSGKGEGKWHGHWKWEWKKADKQGKDSHNTADMLNDIEKQSVDAIEIDLLEKQYEEEIMANELYMSFYEKYGIETFKKIAESEAKHMEAVKALLDRYDIEVPTNYDHIQDLYDSLKESGAKSAFDALEVWVKIEFVDIDDIVTAIKSTDNDDIKVVLTNIGGASYNHLRGFLKAINNNGYETELDWKKYLDESDLSVKWPIKYKLAEKLEAEWVELPEQVSSETMKNKKCDDDHGEKGEWKGNWQGQNSRNSENVNKGQKGNQMWNRDNVQNGRNSSQFTSYKASINAKYGAVLDALSDAKLEILVEKIDALSEKVKNSSDYTQATKQKYSLILWALKEIALEKLGSSEVDLDWLFQ